MITNDGYLVAEEGFCRRFYTMYLKSMGCISADDVKFEGAMRKCSHCGSDTGRTTLKYSYEATKAKVMGLCFTVFIRTDSTNGRIAHLAAPGSLKTCCGDKWTHRAWFRHYYEGTGCSACLNKACDLDPDYVNRFIGADGRRS